MNLLWVSLAGMLVYLDTTAVAQFMICQPIIACPLWGLLVGQPIIGMFFGIGFQLLYLGTLPVGASKFPEGNLGALVATALAAEFAISGNQAPSWMVLTLATGIGILTAHFGSYVTSSARRILVGHTERVVLAAKSGQSGRFITLFYGAVGIHALAGLLLTATAVLLGRWILPLGNRPSFAGLESSLSALEPGLIGAGAAVIAARFVRKKTLPWFSGAALLAGLAGWLWL